MQIANSSDRPVIVYGTGKVAERFLSENPGLQILGIMDRNLKSGFFNGHPIIDWQQLEVTKNGLLIVASSSKNYKEIYFRIREKCLRHDLEIIGVHGEDFRLFSWYDGDLREGAAYYQKNYADLKESISKHDHISFDVFDTLVERSLPDPSDVFDLIDLRLRDLGIVIEGYKELRLRADRNTPLGTIYDIYNAMEKESGVSKKDLDTALKTELQCEKEELRVREPIFELFKYALSEKKHVSLISDMYIPGCIMEKMLEDLGITGFEKLYVSCDYSKNKAGGLYSEYIGDEDAGRYLHIGDNPVTDVQYPRTIGMDSYYIKSSVELMKLSNIHFLLGYADKVNDRIILGDVIDRFFNYPFKLGETSGCLAVSSIEEWSGLFLGPVMVLYILRLAEYIKRTADVEGVLFAARDGYIPQKLYEIYRDKVDQTLPQSYLLPVSRKLAISLCDDVSLKQRITGKYGEELCVSPEISEKLKQQYLGIIGEKNIEPDRNYIFSEIYSMGTTQAVLDHLFTKSLKGYYLMRYDFDGDYGIPIESVYLIDNETRYTNYIATKELLLEVFLSAPYPSINGISEDGFVYEKESRSEKELDTLYQVEKGLISYFENNITKLQSGEGIGSDLPERIMRCVDDVVYSEDAKRLLECIMHDGVEDKHNKVIDIYE